MRVWRIATDTPTHTADDLRGLGAKVTGGRWNRAGLPVVYCAESISLAAMETLVHLGAGGLPLNRYLVSVEIPEAIWLRRQILPLQAAPVGWDALPTGKVSLDFGDGWLSLLASALLVVPSIVVPEESNILINPQHPDASGLTATKLRKWRYDERLLTHAALEKTPEETG
jgi:RES domain-containing protein